MIRRVAIVGAEFTGKAKFAQELAGHFQTVWVPEYGREYTEISVGRQACFDYKWRDEEFVHIAKKQVELEDKLARKANRVLICDTDVLATCIWQERYLGHCSDDVASIARQRRYDLYVLADCDIPFMQDGLRDGEHLRQWMTNRFREELTRRKLPSILISGSHEQRLRAAIAAIEKLL